MSVRMKAGGLSEWISLKDLAEVWCLFLVVGLGVVKFDDSIDVTRYLLQQRNPTSPQYSVPPTDV